MLSPSDVEPPTSWFPDRVCFLSVYSGLLSLGYTAVLADGDTLLAVVL